VTWLWWALMDLLFGRPDPMDYDPTRLQPSPRP
jgi:hypothetical protein